jgi:hypothetical protein
MSRIKRWKLSFDYPFTTEVIMKFNIYYSKIPVNYESPRIEIPAVEGQTTYEVDIPAQIPISDGQYQLGVSAVDIPGNESDIVVIDYFFKFIVPLAPVNLKIGIVRW